MRYQCIPPGLATIKDIKQQVLGRCGKTGTFIHANGNVTWSFENTVR